MSDVSVNTLNAAGADDIVALMRQLMNAQSSGARRAQQSTRLEVPQTATNITAAPVQAETVASSDRYDVAAASVSAEAGVNSVSKPSKFGSLHGYLLLSILFTVAGLAMVVRGNQLYAPEMYGNNGMVPAAEAASQGLNYAVFDLNINIRHLRDEVVKRMTETPDVVLLGASHYQEGRADLVKPLKMYNAHIHRDYWEDPLGVVEIFERAGRLPKRMIISIRDKQFTPVEARGDYLWEPGIPYYRDMANRIGLPVEPAWKTWPYDRLRALFSLSMLFENLTRWHNAPEYPHPSADRHFKTLDTLMPDGSILWSDAHKKIFTADRRRNEVSAFLKASLDHPPLVDPKGVEAFNALLDHLKEKGVQVYLVNPPFNPEFYDGIKGSRYEAGLKNIEELTQSIAREHGLKVFGSFNPHVLGCTADQYIDAEHSNPTCLQSLFNQFNKIVAAEGVGK